MPVTLRDLRLTSLRELKVKNRQPARGRENAGDQVGIGVRFVSDWLRW